MKKTISGLIVGSLISSLSMAAPYTITDLGDLAESTSFGTAINNNGLVVGNYVGVFDTTTGSVEFNSHAFTYDGVNFFDLGTLSPSTSTINSFAYGVNDAGDVVGSSSADISSDMSGTFSERAFIEQNGVMSNLGIPSVGFVSRAIDINNNGIVAGYVSISDDPSASQIIYSEKAHLIDTINGNTFTNLGTLRTDNTGRSVARAINDVGQVVGWSDTEIVSGIFESHAFFYDPQGSGVLEDLGTFGGTNSFANDINASGLIVGSSTNDNKETYAFTFKPGTDTALVQLGVLNTDIPFSVATGVNDSDQVVGFSVVNRPRQTGQPAETHAVLFENGTLTDLNTQIDCSLGWSLIKAEDIDNNGVIVGSGLINNETHGFILTPNPNGGAAEQCPVDATTTTDTGGGSLGYYSLLLLLLGAFVRNNKRATIKQ